MQDVERALRKFFRIKRGDNSPQVGWLNSTRESIYEFMAKYGGFALGAEIGVQSGKNAKMMLDLIPGLTLICIDPWKGFSRTTNEVRASRHYNQCVERLKGCPVKYMVTTSLEAVQQIEDGSLDFVYIDALHNFCSVMMDIIQWTPKVRKGGIVAGHDYFENYKFGVVDAVRAYTRANNIHNWYVTKEKYASWFFVKS